MTILHVLAGLSLLGLSVYSLVCSLRRESTPHEQWKVLAAFTGLLLAFVLFTGFIQLGSRYSVGRLVLYKLGATATGGVIVLLALIARLKEAVDNLLVDLALVLGIFLFGVSLYLGIVL